MLDPQLHRDRQQRVERGTVVSADAIARAPAGDQQAGAEVLDLPSEGRQHFPQFGCRDVLKNETVEVLEPNRLLGGNLFGTAHFDGEASRAQAALTSRPA